VIAVRWMLSRDRMRVVMGSSWPWRRGVRRRCRPPDRRFPRSGGPRVPWHAGLGPRAGKGPETATPPPSATSSAGSSAASTTARSPASATTRPPHSRPGASLPPQPDNICRDPVKMPVMRGLLVGCEVSRCSVPCMVVVGFPRPSSGGSPCQLPGTPAMASNQFGVLLEVSGGLLARLSLSWHSPLAMERVSRR
jgi:hypothetical protein